MVLPILATNLDPDEKYIYHETIDKIAKPAMYIGSALDFYLRATSPAPFAFNISSFVLSKSLFFTAKHLYCNHIDSIKERCKFMENTPGLREINEFATKHLSSKYIWDIANYWFDAFTSIWFFKSLLNEHTPESSPQISLPFCAVGALASNILIHKSVEVLDPKRKWAKQEILDD